MFFDQIETGSFGELTPHPDSLHVLSWNINRGLRFDAIIEFLTDENADLILLQESDFNARRTAYRNVTGRDRRTSECTMPSALNSISCRSITSQAFHGPGNSLPIGLCSTPGSSASPNSRDSGNRGLVDTQPTKFPRRAGGRDGHFAHPCSARRKNSCHITCISRAEAKMISANRKCWSCSPTSTKCGMACRL